MNTQCLLQGKILDFQFIFPDEDKVTGDVYFQVLDASNNYNIVAGTAIQQDEMVFGSGELFRDYIGGRKVDYLKEYFSYIVNIGSNPPYVKTRYNNDSEIGTCNFGTKEKISIQEYLETPYIQSGGEIGKNWSATDINFSSGALFFTSGLLVGLLIGALFYKYIFLRR